MSRLRQWTNIDGSQWECDAYDHGPMCRQCRQIGTVEMQTLTMTPTEVEDLLYALSYAVSAKPNGYHVGAAFKTLDLCRKQGVGSLPNPRNAT